MQRILFIELLGGLGDTLIALPAMQALAASYPQAHFTVLTFEPGGELLQQHPLIHTVIQIPKGTARQAVEKQLQTRAYDLIVTDVSYEGIADLVQHSGAERVVTNLWRKPPDNQLVCDRMLEILLAESLITPETAAQHRHPKIYLTDAEREQAQAQLGVVDRPLICLYPDAGMSIKHWSTDHFVALGQALQERYNAHLIVPEGGSSEQVATIIRPLPNARPWPRGSLRQLAALFAQVDCVVAGDTGPARIAAAMATPTVTLFGPSWQGRYGQPEPHINLQGYAECPERNIDNFTEQACWYSGQCPFEWDTCVNLITPEQVLAAVDQALRPHYSTQPLSESLHSKLVQVAGFSNRTHSDVPLPDCFPASSPFLEAKNILVMRLDNIGDVLMTSPALRAIKENCPDARLTLMASPGGALTEPLLPWVDEVLPWRVLWQDLGRLPFDPAREWDLIHTLKDRQFDAAIIFTSFKQSPHPAAWVCQMAGIPLRAGESKEASAALTHAVPCTPDEVHQVERNLHLIESVGYVVQNRNLALAVPSSELVPSEPYLLLNPWTSCQSRTYDLERFAIAARHLSQLTGYPVVITGTEKEAPQAAPMLNILGDTAINLIGKTTLSDLVALIAQAKLLLSNNTSTMHIADATQTPSVILFAGTELECQWQPRQTQAILLRRPTPCAPCYQFTCPYQLECLDIEPEAVVEAGLRLLQKVR
ncbi:MAG TPA: glycosyltransferase family 9 protein [Leptolyngbyaceae cyanobacterium]